MKTEEVQTLIDDDDVQTLTADDRIFAADGPPSFVAVNGSWGSADYQLSYKDAADRLVRQATDGTMDPDLLFLPIAFLYRHWTEVALKSLIELSGETPSTSHDLLGLFQDLRRACEKLGLRAERDELVEARLQEWMEYDKIGTAFRYARDTKGNLSLPSLSRVNLVAMSKTITKLRNAFDGYSGFLSEHVSRER